MTRAGVIVTVVTVMTPRARTLRRISVTKGHLFIVKMSSSEAIVDRPSCSTLHEHVSSARLCDWGRVRLLHRIRTISAVSAAANLWGRGE